MLCFIHEQTLHHLFPAIDHSRLHAIRPLVSDTAKEFNLELKPPKNYVSLYIGMLATLAGISVSKNDWWPFWKWFAPWKFWMISKFNWRPPGGGHRRPPHSVSTSPIAARTRKHRHSRQTSRGSARSWPLFVLERPNDAGQVGGKVFATKEKPSGIVWNVQNLRKSSPDPPKSRPGAFKIEPGALQDATF